MIDFIKIANIMNLNNYLYNFLLVFTDKGGIFMWIILGIIVIGCIAGACASYLRANQNDIGGGLGKKSLEDHWGISDKKKY